MAELIWDGKYDKDGKTVAPLRVPLPFQTVETINESAQEWQLGLEEARKGLKWEGAVEASEFFRGLNTSSSF